MLVMCSLYIILCDDFILYTNHKAPTVQSLTDNRVVVTMLILASFMGIVAGLKVASAFLVPILLAIFIATISAPPLLWLKNKGLPTAVALLVVILSILLAGSLVVAVAGTSVTELQNQLPSYAERLHKLLLSILAFTKSLGIEFSIEDIEKFVNPSVLTSAATAAINELGQLLTKAFLIFLMVVFILLEVSTLPAKLNAIFSKPGESLARLDNFKSSLQRYLLIKTLTSLATGILVGLWLWVLGVDFAVLWALLAFLLNFVPNIGSIIAAIPAVLVALLQTDVNTMVWVILGYVVINVGIGTVLEPRLAGKHLGLSPMIVFFSLVFWGWVLGAVGMLLSVPLTMIVRLVAESNEQTRWLAVLLSDRAPEEELVAKEL